MTKRKEQFERKCIVCGNTFMTARNNHLLCSDECRIESNRAHNRAYWREHQEQERQEKQQRYKTKEKIKPLSFSEIIKAAKQSGMSYGQYVIEMERKKTKCND